MTAEEIKQGNELIAKFMGIEEVIKEDVTTYRLTNSPYCILKQCSHFPSIPFNVSWDWIMPVVEKINTLNLNKDGSEQFEVTISHNACEIVRLWCGNIQGRWGTGTYNKLSTIESVWKACIEFIKWYNSK